MTLDELLLERRLILCVGPGGVGKTTLAATLALRAARAGRRVAVITIDPARRLADALGLDGLDDELRPVENIGGRGRLDAAMLDTKSSYDALIARVTDDPEAREAILANRVYQSFSRTLARSHAYIAMERLHAVMAAGEHDLVVLDTPPTRSALDILDAPGRLSRFLDERVLGAFLGGGSGGATGWIRAKGTEVALRLFGAMVGDALMGELAGFFGVLAHLRDGFAARADDVQRWLRDPETAFVLVTAPQANHLADAAYLRDGLLERGASIEAVFFNRAHHAGPDASPIGPASLEDLDEWPTVSDEARRTLAVARALRDGLAAENAGLDAAIRGFEGGALRLRLPILEEEPTTLVELLGLLAAAC